MAGSVLKRGLEPCRHRSARVDRCLCGPQTGLVAAVRYMGLPSIAYRLARVAAGDGVAAVSLNAPCGWDYAAGHALIHGAGGILLNEAGHDVTYTSDRSSETCHCFGGGHKAVHDLAGRNWSGARDGRGMSANAVASGRRG